MVTMRSVARRIAPTVPPFVHRAVRFRRESQLVRGRLRTSSEKPSVLFFTTRKCASTFLARLFRSLNRRHLELLYLDLAAYTWETRNEPVVEFVRARAGSLFLDKGIFYGPLRFYVDTSHLTMARRFAMLRDPRDVIVSDYFSVRYSHRPAASRSRSSGLQERRNQVAGYSVEEYALAAAPYYRAIFDEYRLNLPRECVLTYEEMWRDFDGWLDSFAGLLGIHLDHDERSRCEALFHQGQSSGEDAQRHRRKGTPGDYAEKLSAEVAAELTAQFSDIVEWLQQRVPPARVGQE